MSKLQDRIKKLETAVRAGMALRRGVEKWPDFPGRMVMVNTEAVLKYDQEMEKLTDGVL